MSETIDVQAAFREFRLVAAQFCDVVDTAPPLDRFELLSRLYKILPRLIHEGIALPSVSVSDNNSLKEIKQTRMKDVEWTRLYELLKEKTGRLGFILGSIQSD